MSRMATLFMLTPICSALVGCDLKKTCTPIEVSQILAEYQTAKDELAKVSTLDVAAARPIIDRLLDTTERLDQCIPRPKNE